MATSQDLLTLVDAAITTRLNGGTVESYNIDGQNVAKTPLKELIVLRDKLRGEVQSQSGSTRNFGTLKDTY